MSTERHKIIPSAFLLLEQDNHILLQRRHNTGHQDGKYSLVSGHVNPGETFTEAIIREAYEEADITLKPENLEVVQVLHRKSGDQERIDVIFRATTWNGKITNKEPSKCDDLHWFHKEDLPDNIVPYVKETLMNIHKGLFYSEFGWH